MEWKAASARWGYINCCRISRQGGKGVIQASLDAAFLKPSIYQMER